MFWVQFCLFPLKTSLRHPYGTLAIILGVMVILDIITICVIMIPIARYGYLQKRLDFKNIFLNFKTVLWCRWPAFSSGHLDHT